MLITVSSHVNSIFSSVSYKLGRTLIDPGDIWCEFKGVNSVLLTHAHFDHIYGLNKLTSFAPDLKVYTNADGSQMLLNGKKNLSAFHNCSFEFLHPSTIVTVANGDDVELDGGLTAKAVFTPGHNPSCITWIIGDAVFTGDSYIPGIKTVTNLPGGNKLQAEESIKLIQQLSIGRTIYPGHKV